MANVESSADTGASIDGNGGRFSIFFNVLGGTLTVTMVVALGVWGYRLTTRDVSTIPVVTAIQGPMRVAPEDPGGLRTEHQGLAVNLVAAGGGAGAPPDRLVLAPDPDDLTDEDLPRSRLSDVASEGASVPPPSGAETPRAGNSDSPFMSGDPAEAEALSTEGHLTADGSETSGDDVPVPDSGVTRSPLPRPRPDRDLAARTIAMVVARSVSAEDRSIEVEASSIPAGTPLAQFGAYDSPEIARGEWERLRRRFPDFLHGRGWFVEETVSGGRSFFRLRTTGFDGLGESKRFCSFFTAEGQDCVVVEMR